MHLAALHTLSQIQLNQYGNLRHFLSIEGLSQQQLINILETAETFLGDNGQIINRPLLDGRTVMNLF